MRWDGVYREKDKSTTKEIKISKLKESPLRLRVKYTKLWSRIIRPRYKNRYKKFTIDTVSPRRNKVFMVYVWIKIKGELKRCVVVSRDMRNFKVIWHHKIIKIKYFSWNSFISRFSLEEKLLVKYFIRNRFPVIMRRKLIC